MPKSNDLKILEENIKNSFSKLKKDIDFVKIKLKNDENEIHLIKEVIKDISNQIKGFSLELSNLKSKLYELNTSNGNKGVLQQSINNQSTINQHSSSQDLPDVIEPLRKEIEEIFESLTTQELNILIAVYDLEKIKGMAVTYMEVARKLNITPSYLRGYLSNMVLKKAPINKIKTRDKKILLSINKKFKSFDESTNFIKNLNEKSGQRTLI
jgi:regulator of replication initiation timing